MPMGLMIAFPWLAGLVAGGFGALWWRWRRPVAAVASVIWALYMVYEWLMKARVLCSGECNIRIDLLLAYPLLLVVSGVAVWRGRR